MKKGRRRDHGGMGTLHRRIRHGALTGLLDATTYLPASEHAWEALLAYLDADGKLREVCVGTGKGDNVPYYLERPRVTGDLHGQAPMLWLARAEGKPYR